MESWSPATANEVASIIEKDLRECPEALAALFAEIRTPLRSVPITRFGNIEHVFVVAEKNGVVVYYEDVEEGFNLSRLAPDGSIATPRWEQWKLHHALWHLEAQLIIQADAFGAT
jgi:hypothetical protein